MKAADKPNVVININGDNNKVILGESHSYLPAIVISLVVLGLVAIAVLTVSLCCPDLLADFVRWIVGKAINN
ncbi:hypothetical protein [Faecalispora jeddahensis]|mgnify:CR=1 FL=1|uniref:hypothetical protein n=1 Tax=Faecalispora jeddahensis TaxID=1414721 RepID=UPI00290A3A30|nr:hypothetical protein [Faecalispora jeddahensis]MDU6305118.1 hypothetical protein [Clostridium sp.]MDU6345564.1 hypothetical protein [Clostridium sp.]